MTAGPQSVSLCQQRAAAGRRERRPTGPGDTSCCFIPASPEESAPKTAIMKINYVARFSAAQVDTSMCIQVMYVFL